jgi:hypothetical protein
MRTITGRFTRRHDGQPAAYGTVKLELIPEEPLADIVPLGEQAERFKVNNEEWRQQFREELRAYTPEHQIAVEEAERFPVEYDFRKEYEFRLDADGCLPPGAEVLGNDELSGTTSYYVTVNAPQQDCAGYVTECFREELRVVGDNPVDLQEAVPREPKVEIALSPRERDLAAQAAIVRDGTSKFGKKNRTGFYAGTIHCPPTSGGTVIAPSLERGWIGTVSFHLPMDAAVNYVSALVDVPAPGELLVGLYDANGGKRLETEIDLNHHGAATAILPATIQLTEGDYFLAFATKQSSRAQLHAIWPKDQLDQLGLMNAGGAPVLGTVRSASREELPAVLGQIVRAATQADSAGPGSNFGPFFSPIVVYFKG